LWFNPASGQLQHPLKTSTRGDIMTTVFSAFLLRSAVAVCAFALLSGHTAQASPTLSQAPDNRDIFAKEFVKARPAKTNGAPAKPPGYRRVPAKGAKTQSAPPAQVTQLGMTLWRLRRAKAVDRGARLFAQEGGEMIELVPERVGLDAPLRIGDRMRISVESQQTGYLYVINSEQYADGSMGDPYLIFPTTNTRSGDNRVTAGRLVEIPAQEDQPNYFRLRQGRLDQVGEVLLFLVTPKPIAGLTPGPKPIKLEPEQVAAWEREWGAQAERFDLVGGGKSWTKEEQLAGADTSRLLTPDAPSPQSIFQAPAKPDTPTLVKIGLSYGAARPAGKTNRAR
jgi:hypothetical protein